MNSRPRSVSKHNPCPVCGGNHKCSVCEDGLILCGRRKEDVPGFVHLGEAKRDPTWNLYRDENDPRVTSRRDRWEDDEPRRLAARRASIEEQVECALGAIADAEARGLDEEAIRNAAEAAAEAARVARASRVARAAATEDSPPVTPEALERVRPDAAERERAARIVESVRCHDWQGRGMPLHAHPHAAGWRNNLGLTCDDLGRTGAAIPLSAFEVYGGVILPGPNGDGSQRGECIAFPERFGDTLEICGYNVRYEDGTKRQAGPHRGIFVPSCLNPNSRREEGRIYLPEGVSNCLALHMMGCNAVGRPSAAAGVNELAAFFLDGPWANRREWWDPAFAKPLPPWADEQDRRDADADPERNRCPLIAIVGDNDRKPDGRWPGRDGAFRTACRLARWLNCRLLVVFPPDGCKDIRDWLKKHRRRGKSLKWLYGTWDQHVSETGVVVKPGDEPPEPSRRPTAAAAAAIGRLAAVLATPLNRHDLSDLCGPLEGATPGRAAGELAAPHSRHDSDGVDYADEEHAGRLIWDTYVDRVSFPCCRPQKVVTEDLKSGDPGCLVVRCKCRNCRCREWLDHREFLNIRQRFAAALKVAGAAIAVYHAQDDAEADGLQRKIRKAGALYRRVAAPDAEGWFLFTTAALAEPAPVALFTDAVAGAEDFRSRLRVCDPARKMPASGSKGWRPPKPERPHERQIKVIGKGHSSLSPQLLQKIAEQVDAAAEVNVSRGDDGVLAQYWIRRRFWTPELREHVYRCMFDGEVWPRRQGAGQAPQDDTWRGRESPVPTGSSP